MHSLTVDDIVLYHCHVTEEQLYVKNLDWLSAFVREGSVFIIKIFCM